MIAHFAKLDTENNVTDVFVVDQSDIDANGGDQSVQAENWVKTNLLKDESVSIKQFSIDGSFRANMAEGNGGYYDSTNDVFVQAKPFTSYTLNNTTWKWEAPVTQPANFTDDLVPDYSYAPIWDEDAQQWYAYNTNEEKVIWNPSNSTWE